MTQPNANEDRETTQDPDTVDHSLDEMFGSYDSALVKLERCKPSADSLLQTLLWRDRIAVAISEEPPFSHSVRHLGQLDRRLRARALHVHQAQWDRWRGAVSPPSAHWWWRLDETLSLPWTVVTGSIMVVMMTLWVDLVVKLWTGGADLLSVFASVLTLGLSAAPLVLRGSDPAGWVMQKLGLSLRLRRHVILGSACAGLLLTLVLHIAGLPQLAKEYNRSGYSLVRAGDLTGARRAFERAVSINPDYAQAYYNLAEEYVDIGDLEHAADSYIEALRSDHTLDLAYNGLGHILTLQGKPDRAIPILYTGLSVAQDDMTRVALYVNLGRAYLAAQRYHEAQGVLAEAISLQPHEAAAHCLLALVGEAIQKPAEEIEAQWRDCLLNADQTTPRGQELATMADAHLRDLEGLR